MRWCCEGREAGTLGGGLAVLLCNSRLALAIVLALLFLTHRLNWDNLALLFLT